MTGVEVIGGTTVVAMIVSSNPDIDAAARRQRTVATAGNDGRNGLVFGDEQVGGLPPFLAPVVASGKGLVTQAELQAAVAGLET